MKRILLNCIAATMLAIAGASPVHAHGEGSALSALSALPMASVIGGSAVAGSVAAIPLALSVSGAVLVVSAVEASARGMVLVLERASDGARASVEIAGRGVAGASLAVGSVIGCSVIGSGVVLSAAGQAIAFIPNAMGRALLHDEQLSY
jgi:hypothetical protein